MSALNFTEIPRADIGINRDDFELFAREFLEKVTGLKIETHPDRGPDAGRDLIALETRVGALGETHHRWLISCKHKAHSGKSVSPDDENDLHDRLQTHSCDGLIIFYSTVPSSGLGIKLAAIKEKNIEVVRYDQARIEAELLSSNAGHGLALRFMPISFKKWRDSTTPLTLDSSPRPIRENFFARPHHTVFKDACEEGDGLERPVFLVIYDAEHSSYGKLDHALGYFTEYERTKRLIDKYFVAAICDDSDETVSKFYPEDYHREKCYLVVVNHITGEIYFEGGVTGNPDSGLITVNQIIKKLEGV